MAFADCTGMEELYIPISVTDIHETAFDGAEQLEIKAKEYSYPYRYAQDRAEKLANAPVSPLATEAPIIIEATPAPTPIPTPQPTNRPIGDVMGTTTIVGNQAVVFMDWEEMEVSYGEDVDAEAFWAELEERKLMEDWTYYGDKSLKSMSLPSGTLELGAFSFARSSLESIDLPHGLNTIQYAAFYHCDELEKMLSERKDSALTADDLLTGILHNRLGRVIVQNVGIRGNMPISQMPAELIQEICRCVKGFEITLKEPLGMESAQVTAGGIVTEQFDPQTMESRIVPGLYACGEVLDIDGDCGGYNLQWAWSSGRLAGFSAGGDKL